MHRSFYGTSILLSVAILLGMLGCDRENPAAAQPTLKQSLSAVGGTYTWRDDLKRYHYSDKARLEEIPSTGNRDAVVPVLVECLDDASPSHSKINGSPVPVGILCYEALTQLIYHELTAPNGDVAATWRGDISPQASAEEMRAAKEAWKKVVDAEAFTFL